METSCPIHPFNVSFEQAKQIQSELRSMVAIYDAVSNINDVELVGGADVAFMTSDPDPSQYSGGDNGNFSTDSPEPVSPARSGWRKNVTAIAVAVTLDVKRNYIVETACATTPVYFPYVPGFLSFREGPAILKALGKLSVLPGVILYDGCGIAHPRGLGLASHMALLTGIPSVGCAKSLLCGTCSKPGSDKGMWTPITYHDRIVGSCVRTRDNVRPVYVSPGSGFSIDSAREIVLSFAVKYRLPEPTRLAHHLVTKQKKLSVNESF